MKIGVLGGSGFLGSHVCDLLSKSGHKVKILDIKKSKYQKENQTFLKTDIKKYKELEKNLHNIDVVFHFAGASDLNQLLNMPLESAELNIIGTLNVLQAMKKNKIRHIVYASTLYTFSRDGGFYRCSKQASEEYIREFYKQFKINYTILRFGSLYGPRSNSTNGMWRIVDSAINNSKIVYEGDPETRREYIHVIDAAEASINSLNDKNFKNKEITITGNQSVKVIDLLNMINEIMGSNKKIIFKKNIYKGHYKLTPYSNNYSFQKKYIPNFSIDLGQGIMDLINEISNVKK